MNTDAKIQIIRPVQMSPDDPAADTALDIMTKDKYVIYEGELKIATMRTIYDDMIENIALKNNGLIYKSGQLSSSFENTLQSIYNNAVYIAVVISKTGSMGDVKIFRNVPILKNGNEYFIGSITSTGFQIHQTGIIDFAENFMKSNDYDVVVDLNMQIVAFMKGGE